MSITEKMRKVFDACTVMAGVEPDFECVYMTKGAALLYLDEIDAENAKLLEQIHWLKKGDILHVLTDQEYIDQCERERLMQVSIDALDKDNAKLREQMERLVTLLRVDCDIDASWDGLRRFWSIGLTEDGCLMRDRARKAEAENAKLRELAAGIGHLLFALDVDYCAGCPRDGINHPCPVYTVKGGECLYETDLRDLGVEVDA